MQLRHAVEFVFWASGALLFYTFVGYGLLISILARLRQRSRDRAGADTQERAFCPSVCVVLVACNEEKFIADRLRNLLASQYPADKLRILFVSDGSTDGTVAQARSLQEPRIEILEQLERSGKAAGLNLAVARCAADILVFTDARQTFAVDAIAHLAAHFADPAIGAVSGALEIAPAVSTTGSGVDAYWRFEKWLRAAESQWDSCIGCTGAIYALRRPLFTAIPEDTLLDDVVIPMQAAVKGARVIHDPAAMAYDPRPLEPEAETRRKRRTLAGGFQMALRYPGWLVPWRNRLWWQLVSHKYLRLVAPLLLASVLACNFALVGSGFYTASFLAQGFLYACAALGMAGWRSRICTLASGFVFLNFMAVRGLFYYLNCKSERGWR